MKSKKKHRKKQRNKFYAASKRFEREQRKQSKERKKEKMKQKVSLKRSIEEFLREKLKEEEYNLKQLKDLVDLKYVDNNFSISDIKAFLEQNNLRYLNMNNNKTKEDNFYITNDIAQYISILTEEKYLTKQEIKDLVSEKFNISIPNVVLLAFLNENGCRFKAVSGEGKAKLTYETIDGKEISKVDVIEYIGRLTHESKLTQKEIRSIILEKFNIEMTRPDIAYFVKANDIPYRMLSEEEKEDLRKAGCRNSNSKHNPKAPKIVGKIEEVISTLLTSEMTIKEIQETLLALFPDSNITYSNVYTYLKNNNMPYKESDYHKSKKTEEVNTIKEDDNIIEEDGVALDSLDLISSINPDDHRIVQENTYNQRLEKVETEVKSVLDNDYQKRGCYISRRFTTKDYIEMLESLKYLKQNYQDEVEKENTQHDIMNFYQDDIIHEMENVVSEEGDTYFQDKLHVLRDERRRVEYDIEDREVLKFFLDNLNIVTLSNTIDLLKRKKNFRDNFSYKVNIDESMASKYDWAVKGEQDCIEKRRQRMTKQQEDKLDNNILKVPGSQLFRVSADITYKGFSNSIPWTRNYIAIDSQTALKLGRETLAVKRRNDTNVVKIENIRVETNISQ